MQSVKKIVLILLVLVTSDIMSMQKTMILPVEAGNWRIVTDKVMGGVSEGELHSKMDGDEQCLHLAGQVSTDNNGGFIQMTIDIDSSLATSLSRFDGIILNVKGNSEPYNIHLRTSYLWLPWQSYRSSFETNGEWQQVILPFSEFQPYKTRSSLRVDKIRRLGVVAIGRDFSADLCVSEIGFYKN